MKTFLIEYQVFDKNEKIIKEGTIKVKNKPTELSAKIGLDKYLRKKIKGFNRLFIRKCKNQDGFTDFFKDICENPFNNFGI